MKNYPAPIIGCAAIASLFAVFLVMCWYIALSNPPKPVAVKPAAPPRKRASEEVQYKRLALIAEMQQAGTIQKFESPRLYVMPRFYRLTFDDKVKLCSLCCAYEVELPQGGTFEDRDRIWIYDALSGKEIGRFTGFGLELY